MAVILQNLGDGALVDALQTELPLPQLQETSAKTNGVKQKDKFETFGHLKAGFFTNIYQSARQQQSGDNIRDDEEIQAGIVRDVYSSLSLRNELNTVVCRHLFKVSLLKAEASLSAERFWDRIRRFPITENSFSFNSTRL